MQANRRDLFLTRRYSLMEMPLRQAASAASCQAWRIGKKPVNPLLANSWGPSGMGRNLSPSSFIVTLWFSLFYHVRGDLATKSAACGRWMRKRFAIRFPAACSPYTGATEMRFSPLEAEFSAAIGANRRRRAWQEPCRIILMSSISS